METSAFIEKGGMPTINELASTLGSTYHFWVAIREFVFKKHPNTHQEWYIASKNYGWSFRIKDKKRVIIYLAPRDGFFQAAFIFGPRAAEKIMQSVISDDVKAELQNAKVYPEGRVLRLEVRDESILTDIKRLIDIKLEK